MKPFVSMIIFLLLLMGFIGWYEYMLWTECLTDHSFWYCLRVLQAV